MCWPIATIRRWLGRYAMAGVAGSEVDADRDRIDGAKPSDDRLGWNIGKRNLESVCVELDRHSLRGFGDRARRLSPDRPQQIPVLPIERPRRARLEQHDEAGQPIPVQQRHGQPGPLDLRQKSRYGRSLPPCRRQLDASPALLKLDNERTPRRFSFLTLGEIPGPGRGEAAAGGAVARLVSQRPRPGHSRGH